MNLSAANHFGGLAKAPGIAAKRSTRLSTSQAAAFDKACEVLNTMPEIVDELLSFFERDHDASRVLETADVRKLRTFRRPDKRMSELLDKLRYSKVNGYDDLIRCLHSVVVMHSGFSTKDLRLGLQYGHGSPLEHVVENTRGRHLLMEFHKVAHSQRAALDTNLGHHPQALGGGRWKNESSGQSETDTLFKNPGEWGGEGDHSQWHGVVTPGSIGHILELSLRNNKLAGHLPLLLGEFRHLVKLDLSFNELEDKLPSTIGQCTCLESVDLRRNVMNGSVPPALGKCTRLLQLHLSSNSFSGPLPFELWSCTAMTHLTADENSLSGSLPEDMCGSMGRLQVLSLNRNELLGPLPASMGLLKYLTVLDLFSNGLDGELPVSLGHCKRLTHLRLGDNR